MLTFQHGLTKIARVRSLGAIANAASPHSRLGHLAARPAAQPPPKPPSRAAHYIAYLFVHSFADWSCFGRSVLKSCAISGTNGSFGLGSVSSDEIERRTLEMVSAGLHWSFKISRQIDPF